MENWKKNLYTCWFGVFIVSVGMSQMAPVLPLYSYRRFITLY